ncbi:MAG: LexA family transcriptional regulator [Phycisphaerales bacterium JB065]
MTSTPPTSAHDHPDRSASLLGQRLREARTAAGMTLHQLAERTGCTKGYLSQIENGKRETAPSRALLEKFEAALGLAEGTLTTVADWLATPEPVKRQMERMRHSQTQAKAAANMLRAMVGTGALDEAFRSGELHTLVRRLSDASDDPTETDEKRPSASLRALTGLERVRVLTAQVPVINKVAAGYPTEFTDLGYPARIADEYVSVPGMTDPDAFAARVCGESMLPDYREGDLVVFSPLADTTPGSDCFVRLERDDETTFKRVFFETGEDGSEMIRLQPLNPQFAPKVVDREAVSGMYKAVFVVRAVG